MHKFKRYSWNDKAFYIITILILTIFFIMVLYPCIFVVSASFSSGTAVQAGKVVLFPVDFSLEGYKTVFNTKTVWIGFANSLFYTFVGTAINVAMTMTAGYCLSRKRSSGTKWNHASVYIYHVFQRRSDSVIHGNSEP